MGEALGSSDYEVAMREDPLAMRAAVAELRRTERAATEARLREAMAFAWDECAKWPSRPSPDDNPYRKIEPRGGRK